MLYKPCLISSDADLMEPNQLSAIIHLPEPWYGWVRHSVVAVVAPYSQTWPFPDIMSLSTYNSRLIAIWDIASNIFFILFSIALGFRMIFIFPFKFLWYNFVIDSSKVSYDPGCRAFLNLVLTAWRNSIICWSGSLSFESCKYLMMSSIRLQLMTFP